MPYKYNPHLHVKIWISDTPGIFLNFENQLRLIQTRVKNPKDIINFVYDSRLLTPASQQALHQFCLKYQIIPHDIRDLFPACATVEEQKLITLYENEIQHLQEGGNLGAASDFLRWLKPIYTLGTYSDFDVKVDTTNLLDKITVEEPLLLNIGSVVISPEVETLGLNNHVIAVVDAEAARTKITKIQQTIIFASERPTDFLKAYEARTYTECSAYLGHAVASTFSMLNMDMKFLHLLDYKGPMTSREMRNLAVNSTKDNYSFSVFALETRSQPVPEAKETCQSQVVELLKKELELFLCVDGQEQSETVLSRINLATTNRDSFLQNTRESVLTHLLKACVVFTSGPEALLCAFEHLVLQTETFNNLYLKFSLAHYGLEKAFISANNIRPHEKATSIIARLTQGKVGEKCDVSWLPAGQKAMREREQKMEQSVLKMQRFFRQHHKKTSNTVEISERKTEVPAQKRC